MASPFDLQGQFALITGAGQGVGRETALLMAECGAGGIVVNDYFEDRAEAVAAEVRDAGVDAIAAPCDVTDFGAVKAMVETAHEAFGRVDVLVNNAGNAGPGEVSTTLPDFWETAPEDWQPWLAVNLFGVMNCCHAVLPGMIERRHGRLITVVSDAGRVGEARYAVYSGAKAGAAGFMRALAKAGGRYMITANCVSLATIETPGLSARLEDPERKKKVLSAYVIRRLGQPMDGAAAITFLAGAGAGWITGQTIPVNGGYAFAV